MNFNMNHINNDNARCQCKLCRMNRALDKESPEAVKQKRTERARAIAKRRLEECGV